MRCSYGERAFSPVLGAVLVVAITIILSVTIGVFVFNLGSILSSENPQQELGIRTTHSSGETTVQVVTGEADRLSIHVNKTEISTIENPSPGDTRTVSTLDGSRLSILYSTNGETRVATSTIVEQSTSTTGSRRLLEDDFTDNSLDTNKWDIIRQDGTIEIGDAGLHMVTTERAHRNTVQTTDTFSPGTNLTVTLEIDENTSSGGYGHVIGYKNDESNSDTGISFRYNQHVDDNYWSLVVSDNSTTETIHFPNWTTEHEYVMSWEEESVSVFRDGKEIATVTESIPQTALPVRLHNTRGAAASSDSDTWFKDITVTRID